MSKIQHPKTCSICQQPIEVEPLSGWADGHNAEPVNSGRCCSTCNDLYVLPARMAAMGIIKVFPRVL